MEALIKFSILHGLAHTWLTAENQFINNLKCVHQNIYNKYVYVSPLLCLPIPSNVNIAYPSPTLVRWCLGRAFFKRKHYWPYKTSHLKISLSCHLKLFVVAAISLKWPK